MVTRDMEPQVLLELADTAGQLASTRDRELLGDGREALSVCTVGDLSGLSPREIEGRRLLLLSGSASLGELGDLGEAGNAAVDQLAEEARRRMAFCAMFTGGLQSLTPEPFRG